MAFSGAPAPVLRCRHCEAEAPPMARFCPECGEAVDATSHDPEPSGNNGAFSPARDLTGQAEQPVPWEAAHSLPPGAARRQAPMDLD
jgi:hypothetical protein